MIGGIDIQLAARGVAQPLETAARAILLRWPQAVFENGLTGERYESFPDVPFTELDEIFVYRDGAAANVWDAAGAIPATHNLMIHLIKDEGLITAVVDERDAAMDEMVSAIASGFSSEAMGQMPHRA